MHREAILLTPGPLTTTLRTKTAMLRDWGSWDSEFMAVTAGVRKSLLDIVRGHESHVVVPLQGSGTFSVEAAVATVAPTDEAQAVSPAQLHALLEKDPSITHVVLIHCETGAGVLNPLAQVAQVCEQHSKGLIVDAMSSFAALEIDARSRRFDALIAASGKCLEGVPGMGFVFLRKAILDSCIGNNASLAMDLYDQYVYMEKTGQWRFTPPTHVLVALAEAIAQFEEEGGQAARLKRYQANCQTLIDGMAALGFKPFLEPAIQAPIIVTFHAPGDARYEFKKFYEAAKQHGFILYPGKLTQIETFRVGCIGAIGPVEMQQAVHAVSLTLQEMGIASGKPA